VTAVATRPPVRFEPAAADGIARIVIDREDDAVNAIDESVIDALTEAVRAARASAPKGLIITSEKPNQWVAGADLKLVGQAATPDQVVRASRHLQATFDELAWLACTTVAAINGAALGGGFELALACDYRVATDERSVVLGQPEVNLGLIPAGGGTQRLPRLIGLQRALDLILSGRRLNARRARRMGVIDEVVHPAVLEHAARAWAAKPKRPLDRPLNLGFKTEAAIELAEQTPMGRQFLYAQARKQVLERTHGHYPAPLKALEAVQIGFEAGMAAGLQSESKAFGELALTETARNLIWLFLSTQRSRKRSAQIDQIGVVGAGFMGAGIAEVAAAAGVHVRVKDVSADAVGRGLASVRRIVDGGLQRRRIEPREASAILGRVSGAADYTGFLNAEVVIEAVFEDLELKRGVIRELEEVLPSTAVIASNTSALPISAIAAHAKHPERVVGMHFFSPAERMPLLEVVRPEAASDEAVRTAVALGATMGKTTIVVGDSPGFYTTRVLGAMLNEAAVLVTEGARLEAVDHALTAFGFPVGPFVLYDEVGLAVAQHAGETVASAFGDRFPRPDLVKDLLASGASGRKAGRGFYLWPPPRKGPPVLRRFMPQARRTANPRVYRTSSRTDFSATEIQERLTLLFVNEAIRCLDEGVLRSAQDGDLGAVLGLGFPPFRGGPFHYADSLGHAVLASKLETLARQHGDRYAPARGLMRNQNFFSSGESPT
jgi:3-hydroxyacyl-CoA dehydrogenase / enoyl-CoA hydratase / 3-hydroxybutyryl-CoA epimerase